MLAVWKKELKSYFYSPIGYIFIAIFMFLAGVFFFQYNINTQSADFYNVLQYLTLIFIFTVPILTMRLICDERKSKTDQMLITAPVRLVSIVMGKYLAALTILFFTIVCTFIYPIIIAVLGKPDMSVVVAGYVGFFLLGSVMVAIGVFLSSVTVSQVTAAVSTLAALFFLNILGSFAAEMPDVWYGWALKSISVFSRFDDFSMGIIGFSPVLYFLTADAIFVFLTVRVIEKRRWSE